MNESKGTSLNQAAANKLPKQIFLGVAVLAIGFFGGWLGAGSRNNYETNNQPQVQQTILNENQLISNIAQEAGASVVSINVTSDVRDNTFGFAPGFRQRSAGTGFIISKEGIVITNRHVVPGGDTDISITLQDGTELDNVSVIGRTNDSDPMDVAFLKINDAKGKDLKPLKLGDSGQMKVGYRVVAIGNALGQFQNTVTQGIISGYGRNLTASGAGGLESLEDMFQTDAAINQGNSGGPLVNTNGEAIGINTAVAGGGAENIGFAIPINSVKGLINSVLKEGKLIKPYLGVRYLSLTDDIAAQLDLTTKRGAYIIEGDDGAPAVLPDSPAAKAGLKDGDIITKVNDTDINEGNSLTAVLGRHSVGDTVTLTVVRDGKSITLKATLAAAPTD